MDSRGDRAVSVTVGYAMNLAIMTVLIASLLLVAGSVVESQTERAIEGELEVIGERTASTLTDADRLADVARADEDPGNAEVRIALDLPRRVAGNAYTVTVDATGGELVLTTSDPDVTVTVPYEARTDVADGSLSGGAIEIVYDPGDDELEVRRA